MSARGRANLQFASLGSGSRGSATVVRCNGTCVLVDCGFSLRELRRRLARLGLRLADLDAVLVTHEHGDHLRGVSALARTGIPVWMTVGTAQAAASTWPDSVPLQHFCSHSPFVIGDLEIQPYPVPHDAREPCQFVLGNGTHRLGLLTDCGSSTPYIEAHLDGCHALLLECNHDETLLASSDYPPPLRRRIGGRLGHLSNRQAAALLAALDTRRLQHVVAAHLSEKNNCSQRVRTALAAALACDPIWIEVATQDGGLPWRELL